MSVGLSIKVCSEQNTGELLDLCIGLRATCLGLSESKNTPGTFVVKLEKVSWYTTLCDLHKSNPFGQVRLQSEDPIPEAWQASELFLS